MKYDFKILEFDKILDKLKTYAKTNYAKNKIDYKLLSSSYDEAILLSKETKEAFDAIVKYQDIPLGGLYDVNEAIHFASIGGMLKADELLNIVFFVSATENTIKYFKELNAQKIDVETLRGYLDVISIPKTLVSSIKMAIDNDGNILDNASRDLFMIRRSIRMLETRLRNKLNELLITYSSYLSDSIITSRNGRMTLPVKIEYKNQIKGVIHDTSSSQSTVYIEPADTLVISTELEVFKNKEVEEIKNILKGLSLLVGSNANELKTNLEVLTKLDIIFAKAMMARENNYYPVRIVDESRFKLFNAKHPLIEANICVPITVELKNGSNAIIITGPNTGGKTVAMKTIGLLHIMAYYGLMIPASPDSTIGYFENILADIGDEQSIAQSLSTFSSHMKRIVDITKIANQKSLVILDEIGSGTDPKEGAMLAIAIIDNLKALGAKIIASTHYSDLKNYAYEHDDILNASVEFDVDSLKPTYRLNMGVSGKSNAILIAKRLGLPDKIINDANNNMESNNSNSMSLISNLEDNMLNIKEREDELNKKILEQDKLNKELLNLKIDLETSKNKILAKAKDEAKSIISDAKEEALNMLKDIKNIQADAVKEHEIASLKNKINKIDIKDEGIESDYDFKEGDYVLVIQYQKNGVISKVKNGKYTVNLGQFAMDFDKSELQIAKKPKEKEEKKTRMSGYNPASNARLSLDLRGKRYEEVVPLLDKFLDDALYGNLDYVSIIHGFGTGTVRKAVWDYLKRQSFVKSYRYGGEGEGLNGVTIVYLK